MYLVTYISFILCLVYISYSAFTYFHILHVYIGIPLFRGGTSGPITTHLYIYFNTCLYIVHICITSMFNKVSLSSGNSKEQVTAFTQNADMWKIETESVLDSTRDYGSSGDVSLAEFLSRPVKIATFAWSTTLGTLSQAVTPWELFLDNPQVRSRVEGYRLLQGKLNVRIILNGGPFTYGMAIASYDPKFLYDNFVASGNPTLEIARVSMLPHVFLNPTLSTGGEMVLPFFSQDNWLDLCGSVSTGMGLLTFRSINNLLHANASSASVDIGVYAWMTDVRLAAPTSNTYATYTHQSGEMAAQSGNEYATGIISKPASAVARIAGMMSRIPRIAPYARATEIAASTIGRMAHVFGYARPAVITEIVRAKTVTNGAMANTDQQDPVTKLTLDSKQELSVDPRVVGLGSTDEMAIAYIAQKEMYVGTATWSESTAVDAVLRTINITPMQHLVNAGNEYLLSPMATVSVPFKYWRGSMRVRIQISASQMHRGRLKLTYDPLTCSATSSFNQVFTRVIDLADSRDFCFDIGWNSNMSWLEMSRVLLSTTDMHHTNAPFDEKTCNGQLKISVLNSLTSPDPSLAQPVYVNLYVSAGEDFEVNGPTDQMLQYMEYFPQSGEEMISAVDGIPESPPSIDPAGSIMDDANTAHVYFGEGVASIRALLKRYCYHTSFGAISSATSFWKTEYIFPFYKGENAALNRHVTGAALPINFAAMTHLNWFTPCYAAWRGGIRYKFHSNSSTRLYVRRHIPLLGSDLSQPVISNATTESQLADVGCRVHSSSFAGATTNNSTTSGDLEVEFPFVTNRRFAPGRGGVVGVSTDDLVWGDRDTYLMQCVTDGAIRGIDSFVSAADDFSLFFWIGQPLLTVRTPLVSGISGTLPTT